MFYMLSRDIGKAAVRDPAIDGKAGEQKREKSECDQEFLRQWPIINEIKHSAFQSNAFVRSKGLC
ncbi:hypothetical protein [Sphingomonas pokkalii]|uniref:hypothetical protein n=1 Tax=Sphingomonas pokkalii TaxID=2175090 RepID=UPI003F60DE60